MLADKLDKYKGRGNSYMNNHIREIQELYKEEEMKKKDGRIENKEVILIKLYEMDSLISSSTQSSSFVNKEINNLLKYMKFVKFPTQTRIFRPPPHYQLLQSREEQDLNFWKEVAIAFVENKYNTETSRKRYPINMFQRGSPHEPYCYD